LERERKEEGKKKERKKKEKRKRGLWGNKDPQKSQQAQNVNYSAIDYVTI